MKLSVLSICLLLTISAYSEPSSKLIAHCEPEGLTDVVGLEIYADYTQDKYSIYIERKIQNSINITDVEIYEATYFDDMDLIGYSNEGDDVQVVFYTDDAMGGSRVVLKDMGREVNLYCADGSNDD